MRETGSGIGNGMGNGMENAKEGAKEETMEKRLEEERLEEERLEEEEGFDNDPWSWDDDEDEKTWRDDESIYEETAEAIVNAMGKELSALERGKRWTLSLCGTEWRYDNAELYLSLEEEGSMPIETNLWVCDFVERLEGILWRDPDSYEAWHGRTRAEDVCRILDGLLEERAFEAKEHWKECSDLAYRARKEGNSKEAKSYSDEAELDMFDYCYASEMLEAMKWQYEEALALGSARSGK